MFKTLFFSSERKKMAELTDEQVLKDLIHLTENKVKETLKNKDIVANIREIANELKEVDIIF